MPVNLESVFHSQFGDRWILTGSAAVYRYLVALGLSDRFAITVNDVDIIYIDNEFNNNGFNGFFRKQSSPQRSMTFINEEERVSFDVNIQRSERYYTIDGVKLVHPNVMLEEYIDNFVSRGRLPSDQTKIEALRSVIVELKNLGLTPSILEVPKGMTSYRSKFARGRE